ncbi:plasmid transfer protein TraA [Streptomyces fradiae]|uniref:plasmid transfer protein TraA n=1 Tax=Streptomyces fradiae TaxID=1906 RepID=UPI003985F5B0
MTAYDERHRTATSTGWEYIPEPAPAPEKKAPKGAGPAPAPVPGSDFMSNEEIRTYSETLRRAHREAAVERVMDAEQLEAVLKTIPTQDGSLGGARMRARRVSRHLRRIAKAEQLIAKEATSLYAAFEREYEVELRKIGRARSQQQRRAPFSWS